MPPWEIIRNIPSVNKGTVGSIIVPTFLKGPPFRWPGRRWQARRHCSWYGPWRSGWLLWQSWELCSKRWRKWCRRSGKLLQVRWEDKNDGWCGLIEESLHQLRYGESTIIYVRTLYLSQVVNRISEPSAEKNRSLRFLFVDRKMLGVRGHACDRAIGL